jgi:hypothetical protein
MIEMRSMPAEELSRRFAEQNVRMQALEALLRQHGVAVPPELRQVR